MKPGTGVTEWGRTEEQRLTGKVLGEASDNSLSLFSVQSGVTIVSHLKIFLIN